MYPPPQNAGTDTKHEQEWARPEESTSSLELINNHNPPSSAENQEWSEITRDPGTATGEHEQISGALQSDVLPQIDVFPLRIASRSSRGSWSARLHRMSQSNVPTHSESHKKTNIARTSIAGLRIMNSNKVIQNDVSL